MSDNRASFESALERHALYLARGDRRGYVVVHHNGEAMSLTRYANLKKKDVEARIGKPEQLQTVDQVRDVLATRLTAAAEKRLQDMKDRHQRERRPLQSQAAQMRQVHRAERKEGGGSARATVKSARNLIAPIVYARASWACGTASAASVGKFQRSMPGRKAPAASATATSARASLIGRWGQRQELQASMARMKAKQDHEREYQRTELAVMLSMMKDSTREDFQDHAQEIDGRKGVPDKGRDQDQERSQGRGRGRRDHGGPKVS